MNDSFYLQDGKQMEITSTMREIVDGFHADSVALVFEILRWVHHHVKQNTDSEYKNERFRKRTADQIIKDGFATGCTDYALVFIALMRAKGIPVRYVEAAKSSWVEKKDIDHIEGHVFAEVFLNKAWFIVDPQAAVIKTWYGKQYQVVATGLDSWDIGIQDFETLREKFAEFLKNRALVEKISLLKTAF